MIKDLLSTITDVAFLRDLFISLGLIVILLFGHAMVRRAILSRSKLQPEDKRRLMVYSRNVSLILFVLGAVVIWGHEIEAFAVSLVAIAAAIVIGTKEIIMCVLGSIYRTTSRAFEVGDRIEVGHIRGRVIDMNLLNTTLVESSAALPNKGTVGRGVVIPNSMFLSTPVYNETMLGAYVLQTIHIALNRGEDWQTAESALLEAGAAVIAEYMDDLLMHVRELERNYAVDTPPTEPRVRISLDDREAFNLHLQLPVPLGQRARIEQRVLREYLLALPAVAAGVAPGARDELPSGIKPRVTPR
ncbi:small-conductance mechanosensitive channel [Silvimonas terrae]|uniref:Small-conductance mechanosensitive channel n=1 Tax=Silvimonas terrae TaxID=300266 RepID=A0A840RE78_9NEIS|nr:mechanosensitive ion channel domain-containing protein [Silvimonas terrae]MBB5190561.1 small-conductance mechanosensitive channel [Silvimonas terrae]